MASEMTEGFSVVVGYAGCVSLAPHQRGGSLAGQEDWVGKLLRLLSPLALREAEGLI